MAAPLRNAPIFGYVRKSTEDAGRQVLSLERQREAITAFVAERGWGEVDRWFSDAQSGKDFDRAGYQALLAAIRAHPNVGGRVVVLDYDRFARPVDRNLQFDDIEYQRQRLALHDAGWSLEYVLTPSTGDKRMDSFMRAMKVAGAGEYIEKLSLSSRSGKRKAGVRGLWNGGPAPFPAERYDSRSGRRLSPGERAPNGASVLGPPSNPINVQHWIDGANALLAGASLDAVARLFEARGVDGFTPSAKRRSPWRHKHIHNIYTNPALVGRVQYTFRRDDGTHEVFEGPAQWAPIVPVALFDAVGRELTARAMGRKRARPNREYILAPECYACGARYVAATFVRRTGPRKGERVRMYTHPVPQGRMNDEQAERTRAAGCKHWYLDAEALERAVFEVIRDKRGSQEFAQLFADLLSEQGAIESHAAALEREAEERVAQLERQRENLRAGLLEATDADARAYLVDAVTGVTRQIKEAQGAWHEARARREGLAGMNDELLTLVDEAENLDAAWATAGAEGVERRRAIIDTWVASLLIEVLPDATGRVRNLTRRLYVALRTLPESPTVCELQPMDGDGSSELSRSMGSLFPLDLVGPLDFSVKGD